ncbi:MAG: RidA family protein [Candidatus Dormibacteraeota bacterium]|nr:RidA family protein [Candidatus Dormibacteraeota bacterium]
MTKQSVRTDQAPQPGGPYSQAIKSGRFVFLSGQGSHAPDGSLPSGVEAQAEQMFKNLSAVAAAAGCDLSDAVQVRLYLTDLANFGPVNEVYKRYFSEPRPARTTVRADLPGPGELVEADAILEASDPEEGT